MTIAAHDPAHDPPPFKAAPEPMQDRIARFPFWLIALILFIGFFGASVVTQPNFQDAFLFIIEGLGLTIAISLGSYFIAMLLGLLTGLMRVTKNVVLNNLGTLYVELVRGIPMLVLIFFIALVAVPAVVGAIRAVGELIAGVGIPNGLAELENNAVPMVYRAVIALAITYGAFLAEIFRAGIQSISRGQMEAARSLGMSYWQAMRHIILPQAIRNVLPALGNDFVAMVKDSSLVSVLAVRDVTQLARLYAGSSFRFAESYTTLVILYLGLTIVLSLALRGLERRLRGNA